MTLIKINFGGRYLSYVYSKGNLFLFGLSVSECVSRDVKMSFLFFWMFQHALMGWLEVKMIQS